MRKRMLIGAAVIGLSLASFLHRSSEEMINDEPATPPYSSIQSHLPSQELLPRFPTSATIERLSRPHQEQPSFTDEITVTYSVDREFATSRVITELQRLGYQNIEVNAPIAPTQGCDCLLEEALPRADISFQRQVQYTCERHYIIFIDPEEEIPESILGEPFLKIVPLTSFTTIDAAVETFSRSIQHYELLGLN